MIKYSIDDYVLQGACTVAPFHVHAWSFDFLKKLYFSSLKN